MFIWRFIFELFDLYFYKYLRNALFFPLFVLFDPPRSVCSSSRSMCSSTRSVCSSSRLAGREFLGQGQGIREMGWVWGSSGVGGFLFFSQASYS